MRKPTKRPVQKRMGTPAIWPVMGLTPTSISAARRDIGEESAAGLGRLAAEKGIEISLHAPYYISMSGIDPEKREGSVRYILESARAVTWMGGRRIVVHTGSVSGGVSRGAALELASDTLRKALRALDGEGLYVTLCMETMGKINQLGTLEEVAELCAVDERYIPAWTSATSTPAPTAG